MIWIILYVICTTICCGVMLYLNDLTIDDPEVVFAVLCGLFWPAFLLIAIFYGLGHCVRLLLTKIIKTK